VPIDDQYLSRFSYIISVHGDREQCTIVESVSAAGRSIPPLMIIVVNDDRLRYYGMRGSIYTPRLEWNHGDEVDATLEPQR